MSEMLTDQEVVTVAGVQGAVVAALDALERTCRRLEASFPDAVREAFELLAQRRGSVAELVATRPGCWEAEHITALAEGYDLAAVVEQSWSLPAPASPRTRETVTNVEMDDPAFRGALGPYWTGVTWHLPKHPNHEAEDFTECRAHIEESGGGWDGCNGCEREPGATGIADHEPLVVVVGTVLYGPVGGTASDGWQCGWDAEDFHTLHAQAALS